MQSALLEIEDLLLSLHWTPDYKYNKVRSRWISKNHVEYLGKRAKERT